ncbi:hypothetical protein D3C86_1545060 [compost metagenome]
MAAGSPWGTMVPMMAARAIARIRTIPSLTEPQNLANEGQKDLGVGGTGVSLGGAVVDMGILMSGRATARKAARPAGFSDGPGSMLRWAFRQFYAADPSGGKAGRQKRRCRCSAGYRAGPIRGIRGNYRLRRTPDDVSSWKAPQDQEIFTESFPLDCAGPHPVGYNSGRKADP